MLKKIVILLLTLSPVAMACDKGCTDYHGNCACEAVPETAPPVKPSDEKPPKSGKPSYESPDVHVDSDIKGSSETFVGK